jgi:hypothetical protein
MDDCIRQPITPTMKTLNAIVTAAVIVASALPALAQQKKFNSSGGNSPHETTSTVIGDRRTGCRVTVTYGRPLSKERKIWGGADDKALVPNGKPWRLGADEATLLVTQQPLQFGELTVPAGAYTLYLVPDENGGKLAISSKIGGWGIPVDTEHDLGRVDLKKDAAQSPVEELTISIAKNSDGTGGTIKVAWDTAEFSAPFTIKK